MEDCNCLMVCVTTRSNASVDVTYIPGKQRYSGGIWTGLDGSECPSFLCHGTLSLCCQRDLSGLHRSVTCSAGIKLGRGFPPLTQAVCRRCGCRRGAVLLLCALSWLVPPVHGSLLPGSLQVAPHNRADRSPAGDHAFHSRCITPDISERLDDTTWLLLLQHCEMAMLMNSLRYKHKHTCGLGHLPVQATGRHAGR